MLGPVNTSHHNIFDFRMLSPRRVKLSQLPLQIKCTELCYFARQPVPVSHHPSHKIIFLMFSLNLSSFSLKPTPLVLSLQALVKGLYLSHKFPLNIEISYTRYFTLEWCQAMYLGIQRRLFILVRHWQVLLAEVRSYYLHRATSAYSTVF